MRKEVLLNVLSSYEDGEDVNLNYLLRDADEYHLERIDDLEERQHQSGFYAFQDMMTMQRLER